MSLGPWQARRDGTADEARSILLIYYVFSLGNNTIWNCESTSARTLA